MRSFRRYAKGFTLIELIVVLAIMGILGLLTIPNMIHSFSGYDYTVCQNNQEAFLKEFYQTEQQMQRSPTLNDLSGYLSNNSNKAAQICPNGGTISVDTEKKQLVCSKHGGIGVEFSNSGVIIDGGDSGSSPSSTGGSTDTGGGTTGTTTGGNDIRYMNAWKNYYSYYINNDDSFWIHGQFESDRFWSPLHLSSETISAVSNSLKDTKADTVSQLGLTWTAYEIYHNDTRDVVFLAKYSNWFQNYYFLMYWDGVLYAAEDNGQIVGVSYGSIAELVTDSVWTRIADYSEN